MARDFTPSTFRIHDLGADNFDRDTPGPVAKWLLFVDPLLFFIVGTVVFRYLSNVFGAYLLVGSLAMLYKNLATYMNYRQFEDYIAEWERSRNPVTVIVVSVVKFIVRTKMV